jgi:hypothetical protein
MSLTGALILAVCLLVIALLERASNPKRHAEAQAKRFRIFGDAPTHESVDESSVLGTKAVQRMLVSGAPPVPWKLRRGDRQVMDLLAGYFARAIPTPTSDGRVSVRETVGYGGPQLALYVPVLSSRSPVAVLARSWDPETEDLEANLFFFGAVNKRLAGIVEKLGYERHTGFEGPDKTVFRNRRRFARQQAG